MIPKITPNYPSLNPKNQIKETDVDIYGESAMALLNDGSYDSGSVEILRSKIISIVKKRLLRIRTPQGSGTVGYQTTDFGYGTEIEKGDISVCCEIRKIFGEFYTPSVTGLQFHKNQPLTRCINIC